MKMNLWYSNEKMEVIKGDYWIRRKVPSVLWNNGYTSKLCENWAFYKDNYVYTRFEELFTFSDEALYTREHKSTLSKKRHSSM